MSTVSQLVRRALSAILPYRPMRGGARHLDEEYTAGSWQYLWRIEELARFSVVAGYCAFLRRGGSILEVGAGEGILQDRLARESYSRYLGIDISATAIARAGFREGADVRFRQADAATFGTEERFDLIVFNEVLEYFDDPLAVVRRYEPMLAPNGLFVVSMFAGVDTIRTRTIWKRLARVFPVLDETRVTNAAGLTWVIRVLAPAGHTVGVAGHERGVSSTRGT